jgi:hypothetical protein
MPLNFPFLKSILSSGYSCLRGRKPPTFPQRIAVERDEIRKSPPDP